MPSATVAHQLKVRKKNDNPLNGQLTAPPNQETAMLFRMSTINILT
jgi:hypothetical protein